MSYLNDEDLEIMGDQFQSEVLDEFFQTEEGQTHVLTPEGEELILKALVLLGQASMRNAKAKGFNEDGSREFPEEIALLHSELSEALEEDRSGKPDLYYTQKEHPGEIFSEGYVSAYELFGVRKAEGRAAEYADVFIRIGDSATGRHFNIRTAVATIMKLRYNRSRPYKHGRGY